MTVTLAEAKGQLRVEDDENDEDVVISGYIAAASEHLASIGVDMTADPLPDAVKQAQLLLICHWFDTREATSEKKLQAIEFGVDRLIAPYRESVS